MIRLGVLLLLFDVYLTWARIEKQFSADSVPYQTSFGRLSQQPIVFQYLFFCTSLPSIAITTSITTKQNTFPANQKYFLSTPTVLLCSLSNLAFHLSIRFLTSSPLSPLALLGLLPTYARPNSVSTALLVSSSTKLFPILMVIWEYDVPAAARSLGWAVVLNNVEALKILLDCSYGAAALLATAGAFSRWAVGAAFLWAAGLEGVDSAGEASVAEDGRALWAMVLTVRDWAGRLATG
ncbi:hypothetical protein RB596_008421 [Gaeumannomyces avenae]